MKKQVTFVSPAVKSALIEIAKTYTESLASSLGVEAEFDRGLSREGVREKLRG